MTNTMLRLIEPVRPRRRQKRDEMGRLGQPGVEPDAPRLRTKLMALPLALVLLCGLLLVSRVATPDTRMLTAEFPQAVSIFKGSDVEIMGVPVGKVDKLTPKGDHVEVVMHYDAKYKLPADVKAAIVTPTLVSDRFVQLAPAYTGGKVMADGGSIPASRTAVPVEMDRIYQSLGELTTALGPDGANKHGSLSAALHSSATALKGNGKIGNQAIANMSEAAAVLGGNSKQLFQTLDQLSGITTTLARNDQAMNAFLSDLSTVSQQLSGESDDLKRALAAIAQAVQVTRDFVKDNKDQLVSDVKELNTTVGILAKEKETLGTVLDLAPLGIGNLAETFDSKSGTVGFRLQVGPMGTDLANVLCMVVTNDQVPAAKDVCALFKALLPSQLTGGVGDAVTSAGVPTHRDTSTGLPLGSSSTSTKQQAPSTKPEVSSGSGGGIGDLAGSLQGMMSGKGGAR